MSVSSGNSHVKATPGSAGELETTMKERLMPILKILQDTNVTTTKQKIEEEFKLDCIQERTDQEKRCGIFRAHPSIFGPVQLAANDRAHKEKLRALQCRRDERISNVAKELSAAEEQHLVAFIEIIKESFASSRDVVDNKQISSVQRALENQEMEYARQRELDDKRNADLRRKLAEESQARKECESELQALRKQFEDITNKGIQKESQIQQLQHEIDRLEPIENDMLEIRMGVLNAWLRDRPGGCKGSFDVHRIRRRNDLVHCGNYVLDLKAVMKFTHGGAKWLARLAKIYPGTNQGKISGMALDLVNAYGTAQLCYYQHFANEVELQNISTMQPRAQVANQLRDKHVVEMEKKRILNDTEKDINSIRDRCRAWMANRSQ